MRKQNKGVKKSFAVSCIIGIAVAVVLIIVFSGIEAYLISNGSLSYDLYRILAGILVFISMFIGCSIANKICSEKYAILSGIIITSLFALQLVCNLVFMDGLFTQFVYTIPSLLAGGICACVLNLLLEKGKKKKRKIRNR